jgi:adenine C2-methylase RlmN of 23S rRNA A2503 and tRNA A37
MRDKKMHLRKINLTFYHSKIRNRQIMIKILKNHRNNLNNNFLILKIKLFE